MSRLRITPWENSQRTVDDLYADMERRISAAPCGNCPVELTSAFLKLCLAQSCGKCVPCRIGLDRLAAANVVNHSLSNFDAVCEAAAEEGKIKPEDIERLKRFRANPSDESWITSK